MKTPIKINNFSFSTVLLLILMLGLSTKMLSSLNSLYNNPQIAQMYYVSAAMPESHDKGLQSNDSLEYNKNQSNLNTTTENNPYNAPTHVAINGHIIPDGYSVDQVMILNAVTKMKESLVESEEKMSIKKKALDLTQQNISRQLEELKQLKTELENQYKILDSPRVKSLVKIYENMKPKEAAKILEDLDIKLLTELVLNMKEIKVAPILANMHPSKAKELSALILKNNKYRSIKK